MKTEEKDILQNRGLKQTPYDVPEGYLSSLEQSLKDIPCQNREKVTTWKKMTPYIAMAAMFALIMAAGGFFVEKSWTENKTTEQYAEVVTKDDILEYLIYTGVEIEELEQY
jgi:hypothetical protein